MTKSSVGSPGVSSLNIEVKEHPVSHRGVPQRSSNAAPPSISDRLRGPGQRIIHADVIPQSRPGRASRGVRIRSLSIRWKGKKTELGSSGTNELRMTEKKNKKINVIRNVLNPKKPKKRMLIKQDTTDIIGSVGEFRAVIAF
jgi:hypothetical protein